jgi:hypothetical protein
MLELGKLVWSEDSLRYDNPVDLIKHTTLQYIFLLYIQREYFLLGREPQLELIS